MNTQLEKICMNKIRAYRVARPTEEELRCRNCHSPIGCCEYKPFNSSFQVVVTKGVVAYRLWGEKNGSL